MTGRLFAHTLVSICFASGVLSSAPADEPLRESLPEKRLPASSVQGQWRRIDTPNFVVIGDVSAGDLREVGASFEGFRDALGRIINDRVTATIVPSVIVVFSTEYMFGPFRPKFEGRRIEVDGLFLPGQDLNYIAIQHGTGLRLLFHEYTHLLVGNAGFNVPVWLGEGLAEFYSTLSIERFGTEAALGGLINDHLARLNDTTLIPIEDLLRIDHQSPLYNEGSRRSVLYAQSWALTHMLYLGQPARTKELAQYVDLVTSGTPSVDAWKTAFAGVDIMRDLERYIRRQQFTSHRYKLNEKLASLERVPATNLTRAEADGFLGHLLVRLNDPVEAAARLEGARQREPDNVRVRVSEALLAHSRGRYDEAAERLKDVSPPGDWLLAYLAGVALADLMEDNSSARTDANVAAARALFDASARDRGMLPNAVYRLASIESSRGASTAETRAALDRARTVAAGRYEYQLLYAQMLASAREFKAARDLLGPMMTSRFSPRVRDTARRLMGAIANAETGKPMTTSRIETTVPGADRTTPPSPTTTETLDAQPITRPLYRRTNPGETRIEGDLTNIECVTGKGITFHVKTADAVERFTVQTFNEVEFITYRDDLRGSISCGPSKSAMPVYLTWKAGATPDSRVPVVLEFLPVK